MTNTNTTTTIEALRREVSILASVLVHDCDNWSESCHCFGAADVTAYETAREALRQAQVEHDRIVNHPVFAALSPQARETIARTAVAK